MASGLEDLRVLKVAEDVADEVWQQASAWSHFERDTVGKQLVRAVDSIGANIAESFGRYGFGEKLQFLYFARGSLFETKYWLNRALKRGLVTNAQHALLTSQLTGVAQQINAFAKSLKTQRAKSTGYDKAIMRETESSYDPDNEEQLGEAIFEPCDMDWLRNLDSTTPQSRTSNLQSPISNPQSQ